MAITNQTKLSAAGVVPTHSLVVMRISFSGDNAYTTGGTTGINALIQGLMPQSAPITILGVIPEACGAFIPQYTAANGGTLLVRQISDGAEAAGAADLSGTTFTMLVLGY